MKATGIIRTIDDLGRIVIPKEIRRTMELNYGDSVEYYIDEKENCLCVKKYKAESLETKISELKNKMRDELSSTKYDKARNLLSQLESLLD